MKKYLAAVFYVFFLFSSTALGDLKLKPVRPEESGEETFNQTLSLSYALESLDRIKESLESFKELSKIAKASVPKGKLERIGNMNWEMQQIGFNNMPRIIEAVLKKQEYLLKKLEYEAARDSFERAEITKESLETREKEFLKAEELFQSFWDGFALVD